MARRARNVPGGWRRAPCTSQRAHPPPNADMPALRCARAAQEWEVAAARAWAQLDDMGEGPEGAPMCAPLCAFAAGCVLGASACELARTGWAMDDDAPNALARAHASLAKAGDASVETRALAVALGAAPASHARAPAADFDPLSTMGAAGSAPSNNGAGGAPERAILCAARAADGGADAVERVRRVASKMLVAREEWFGVVDFGCAKSALVHARYAAALAVLAQRLPTRSREAVAARHGALTAAAEVAKEASTPALDSRVAVWLAAAMVALGESVACADGCC